MAELLKGATVAAVLNETVAQEVAKLESAGVFPTLAIVRIGERPDDISYERGAMKRCEKTGIKVKSVLLPVDIQQEQLIEQIKNLNEDHSIHGVLLFRPLPDGIDDNIVRNILAPEKDVDGITDSSLVGIFSGTDMGYPPCTAQACIEILDHYGVELKGKRVVVIGRSLVIGKPVAMMLLKRNATVTICHTRTKDMPGVCREGEILIAAAGRAGVVDKTYFSTGQTIIDVGINVNEDGKLCGDVDFADAEQADVQVTPVPGGLGTVTTSILVKHVVEAAKKQSARK